MIDKNILDMMRGIARGQHGWDVGMIAEDIIALVDEIERLHALLDDIADPLIAEIKRLRARISILGARDSDAEVMIASLRAECQGLAGQVCRVLKENEKLVEFYESALPSHSAITAATYQLSILGRDLATHCFGHPDWKIELDAVAKYLNHIKVRCKE